MEFGLNKDAFCYDQEQMSQGTFPFLSSSSSTSSPSSISHHQRTLREAQIYSHHRNQTGGWYGNYKFDSNTNQAEEISRSCNEGVAPMERDHNDNDEDEDVRRREEQEQSLALGGVEIEREHMFDKVVTPSDVGKLNRLVIPKQHAEKYFPLDSSTNEKGLLLNFEDRSGKPWRFRYSYWNSSQSYVMTKGWSRFVKEKKLDAGDIVSFQRGVGELGKDRLYIDWRRRPNAPDVSTLPLHNHFPFNRNMPWTPLFMRPQPAGPAAAATVPMSMFRDHNSHLPQPSINFHYSQYRNNNSNNNNNYNYYPYSSTSGGSVVYLRSPQEIGMVQVQDGVGVQPMVIESVPVVHGKAAAKRLRLFGVNMDCPISSDECDILSSTTIPTGTVIPSHQASSSSFHHLQPRFYNGTPVPNKGKASLSLDLDI